MRLVSAAVLVCLAAGCAGCPGTRSKGPGTVFVERRPVQDGFTSAIRGVEFSMDTEPLSPRLRTHPAVGKLRGRGSLSIGSPVDGFVFNAAELPLDGQHHRVMPEQAGRATRFGTDELVAAIMKAGADVARSHPGSVLPVGNMGRGGGGELKWSISHRSGRDVDLGFYLKDGDGQVFQPAMTIVQPDGSTALPDGTVARFDVARNWALVKSLLTNRKISVQWIFTADHLKNRLLDYARSRREPASLLKLADDAIAQPRGRRHDDHFHVRIYCSADDLLEGCVDIGSNRPWFTAPGPALQRRWSELVRLAGSPDPAVRRDALEVIGNFGDKRVVAMAGRALSDRDVGVRRVAAAVLAHRGVAGVETLVARAVADRTTPDDAAASLLRTLTTSRRGARPANGRMKALQALLKEDRKLVVDNGVFVTETVVSQAAALAAGVAGVGGPGGAGAAN